LELLELLKDDELGRSRAGAFAQNCVARIAPEGHACGGSMLFQLRQLRIREADIYNVAALLLGAFTRPCHRRIVPL
jgi:hypothetical protein